MLIKNKLNLSRGEKHSLLTSALKRQKGILEGPENLTYGMIIQNFNIFQADYEGVAPWRGNDGANDEVIHQVIKTIIPVQFQSDVKALCDYAGVDRLERGMAIKMTLQEILTVIPKKRRRIESYKSLISFLEREMGVILELTSKKTKTNG